MDTASLYGFLSPENIALHYEHFRNLKSKMSIYTKSLPEYDLSTYNSVLKSRLNNGIKNEILPLILSIELHKSFFSSFSLCPCECPEIKRSYSSADAFLYDVLSASLPCVCSFVLVYLGKSSLPEYTMIKSGSLPVLPEMYLAIDLFEHAYFLDYGFDRENYVRRALAHLDLKKLYL